MDTYDASYVKILYTGLGVVPFPGTNTHQNKLAFNQFVAKYKEAFKSPDDTPTIVVVEGRNGRIFILDSINKFWENREKISGKRGIEGMMRIPLEFWRKYMHDAYPPGRVKNLTDTCLSL